MLNPEIALTNYTDRRNRSAFDRAMLEPAKRAEAHPNSESQTIIKMKLRIFILLFVLTGISGSKAGAGPGPFSWLTDLDQARVLASSQNKPMFIVFRCEP